MQVEVLTGFDGSSPYADAGVRWESERQVVLRPGLRRVAGRSEEAPGAGSRFSTRLRNVSGAAAPLTVVADWEAPGRVGGHDLGYWRPEGAAEWTMIPGHRRGATRIEYALEVPPGTTELGLYPEFNCGACDAFVTDCARRGVGTEVIGKSREGRDLWLLTLPSPNAEARPFFFQARDHAYETAGSYAVLGVVDFLLGGAPLARYLRSKFRVHIVPMTNPDGVYNGMSRLTWEQGADMNRVQTVPDPAHDALQTAIDCVRPVVHMNLHNWTSKFTDGLLANDASIAERILVHLPADSAHHKRWQVESTADYIRKAGWADLPPEVVREKRRQAWSWKNYCQEQFGAVGVNFEFPWFALDTAAMRAKGARAFAALALAAIDEKGW